MQRALGRFAMAVLVLFALVSCGDREPRLLNLKADTTGPDEFMILPTKPLEAPENYTDLPDPTPGGSNRTDPTPLADAVDALGGDGARVNRSGLYAGEAALVQHSGRFGVSPTIREDLAAEDLEFRRRNNGRLLERLFNVSVYFKAYRSMSLNQYLELARLRSRGVWTPAVPPEGAQSGK